MRKMKWLWLLPALLLLALCACAPSEAGPEGGEPGAVADGADETQPEGAPPAGEEGPDAPEQPQTDPEPVQPGGEEETAAPDAPEDSNVPAQAGGQETAKPTGQPEAEKPAEKPAAPDAGKEETPPAAYAVTLSVQCGVILDNMEDLDPDKAELVPADGVLYAATELEFTEGESVFDVLSRAMKDAKIHMEYSSTPVYQSAYIEGIGNLYELDCGPLSGWMYRVNGEFPPYGCSRWAVQAGDVIEWIYTCDLGRDIGGGDALAGQKE